MNNNIKMEKTRQAALEWVKSGKPCTKRYGFAWKGACQNSITNEEALEKISNPVWEFSMGYHELYWDTYNNQVVLCFNEYSESDME